MCSNCRAATRPLSVRRRAIADRERWGLVLDSLIQFNGPRPSSKPSIVMQAPGRVCRIRRTTLLERRCLAALGRPRVYGGGAAEVIHSFSSSKVPEMQRCQSHVEPYRQDGGVLSRERRTVRHSETCDVIPNMEQMVRYVKCSRVMSRTSLRKMRSSPNLGCGISGATSVYRKPPHGRGTAKAAATALLLLRTKQVARRAAGGMSGAGAGLAWNL